MLRSRPVYASVAIIFAVAGLTACTPQPTNPASQKWADEQLAAAPHGSPGGVVTAALADGEGEAAGVLQLELDSFAFTTFTAGCAEGGPAKLIAAGAAAGEIATSLGIELECDGVLREYELPGGGGADGTTVTFGVQADEPVSVVAYIPSIETTP